MTRNVFTALVFGAIALLPPAVAAPQFPLFLRGAVCADGQQPPTCDGALLEIRFDEDGTGRARLFGTDIAKIGWTYDKTAEFPLTFGTADGSMRAQGMPMGNGCFGGQWQQGNDRQLWGACIN